jgi:outer membrane protein assembly factor BamA
MGNVIVNININEGKRFYIRQIQFEGDILLDTLIYIIPKKMPIAYSDEFMNAFESQIYYLYYNNGFPFISVLRDTIFENDSSLIIKEKISAGKRIMIKQIKIEGNKNVRDAIFF